MIKSIPAVIDFGLKAIRTRDLLPPECRPGDFVTGEIYVGLPICIEILPDGLFASLAHKWEVLEILADLTPHPEHHISGGSLLARERRQVRYEQVSSTKAVEAQAYFMRCRQP